MAKAPPPTSAIADALEFVEGLAPACTKVGPDRWLWGYIDKSGTWVIDPQFESAGLFGSGLAPVQTATSDLSGKWGYIDRSGKYVIEPRYWRGDSFSGGLAYVWLSIGEGGEEGYAYIDLTGNPVWVGP